MMAGFGRLLFPPFGCGHGNTAFVPHVFFSFVQHFGIYRYISVVYYMHVDAALFNRNSPVTVTMEREVL